MSNMELLFYMGMLFWGFYLLCTESVEDIKRDFGIRDE